MAEKAQAEPTMEEILASIRKIIADDTDAKPSARAKPAEPKVSVAMSEEDDFDDLSLDDVMDSGPGEIEALAGKASETFDSIVPEDDDDDILADVDEEMFEELTADSLEASDEVSLEDDLDDFDFDAVSLDKDTPVIDEPDMEDDDWAIGGEASLPEEEPAPAMTASFEAEPKPSLRHKAEPVAASAGITDERIAGAAASALGKLMVKQAEDAGNPNTLEGLMMEMLRPMLKEWLDANLPTIVERKVEEEVRRIARMAG